MKKNLLKYKKDFYPSLLRRLKESLSHLNSEQRQLYREAQKNLDTLKKVTDPQILDALVDYWKLKNYQLQTNMKAVDHQLLEKTFELRASQKVSTGLQALKLESGPPAPYEGHEVSWIRLGASREFKTFRYRFGTHAFDQQSLGYDDFAPIEYLGFDLQYDNKLERVTSGSILIADIRSFEDFSLENKTPSWLAKAYFESVGVNSNLVLRGGWGFSSKNDSGLFYILPILELKFHDHIHSMVGILSGVRIEKSRFRFIMEPEWNKTDDLSKGLVTTTFAYSHSPNAASYLKVQDAQEFQYLFEVFF